MTLLERIVENPGRLRRWSYAALAAIAIGEIALPRLTGSEPPHFWFEDLPAWGSLYGFLSCVAIVIVSKLLGKLWLARPDTYYDR